MHSGMPQKNRIPLEHNACFFSSSFLQCDGSCPMYDFSTQICIFCKEVASRLHETRIFFLSALFRKKSRQKHAFHAGETAGFQKRCRLTRTKRTVGKNVFKKLRFACTKRLVLRSSFRLQKMHRASNRHLNRFCYCFVDFSICKRLKKIKLW